MKLQASFAWRKDRSLARYKTRSPLHETRRLFRGNGQERRAHGAHPAALTRRERWHRKERGAPAGA